nr:leucine-rich repeat-containing protein 23 [Hydra vulgaris]
MNINLHYNTGFINLELERIIESHNANDCLKLLIKKLDMFNVSLSSDVVCITTDGASVMEKLGNISPAEYQLCFAHAIHLVVVDVIYKNKVENNQISNEEDIEDDFDVFDDDYTLKDYSKSEFGQELVLILDSKTHWNSMLAMIQRFIKVKKAVGVLIYVKENSIHNIRNGICVSDKILFTKDISENKIRDISPINHLTHLLTLKADKNLLKSGLLNKLPYLQHIDFSNNQIKDLFGINHPLLEKLNLNGNEVLEISSFDAANLSYLAVLELRGNKLTSTKCTYPQSLKMLYLAENAIEEIQDVSQLTHLKTLHLRNNKITNLNGFSENMKNLQYLNLRMNNISELHEINKLKCLPMLRALILIDNPICYEESYRIEVLVILRRLERLDHDVYVDEERKDAEEIYNERNSIEKAENVITE